MRVQKKHWKDKSSRPDARIRLQHLCIAICKWIVHSKCDSTLFELVIYPESDDEAKGILVRLSLESDFGRFFEMNEFYHLHEKAREEFDEILEDHGFWYEFENAASLFIMSDENW